MNRGKKQLIVGYAIFSLFFFILIFGFWLFKVEEIKIVNREHSKDNLIKITESISRIYRSTRTINGARLHTIFSECFNSDARLINLLIYSKEYGIIYADGRERSFIKTRMPENGSLPPDWNGEPQYELPSGVELFRVELNINSSNRFLFLDGIYIIFGSEDYTKLLWIVLLILIGFFMFTLIIIISVNVLSRSSTQRREIKRTAPYISPEDSGEIESQVRNSSINQALQDKPDDDFQTYKSTQKPVAEEPVKELLDEEQPPTATQDGKGLFSPHTGLGFREHLEQRMKFELERAASFDQDLVLVLIKIFDDNQKQLNKYRIEIAKAILNYFPFQDLAFEFSADAFAIIIPESDIDTALKNLDIFRKYINEKNINLVIGLSSRNGRLLSAKLLLSEAYNSLKKAINQGKNTIIAFRADPNKYRDIL